MANALEVQTSRALRYLSQKKPLRGKTAACSAVPCSLFLSFCVRLRLWC